MNEARYKEEGARCPNRGTLLPALRALRQSKGLSQQDLSELAEVSAGTVYRLEHELRGAYPQTIRKLAAALGVSPVELVQEPRPARERPEGY
jgi:transcriptional regulator with XRE-family HTH domain